MSTCNYSRKNLLLDSLSVETRRRLDPDFKVVSLEKGAVLSRSGETMSYVYFPIDAIVSLLCDTKEGASTEISLIGNDGFIGIAAFTGGESIPIRAVVQMSGVSYRLSYLKFKEELNQYGDLHELMLRYTQSLFTQMALTAVCNRHHTIHQQVCRFLLLMLDRLSDNRLLITQETIANLLGVRRESVTEAAGRLQKLGVIEYRRGCIAVLDRDGLVDLTCECYAIVKGEANRLLLNNHLHRKNIHQQSLRG